MSTQLSATQTYTLRFDATKKYYDSESASISTKLAAAHKEIQKCKDAITKKETTTDFATEKKNVQNFFRGTLSKQKEGEKLAGYIYDELKFSYARSVPAHNAELNTATIDKQEKEMADWLKKTVEINQLFQKTVVELHSHSTNRLCYLDTKKELSILSWGVNSTTDYYELYPNATNTYKSVASKS